MQNIRRCWGQSHDEQAAKSLALLAAPKQKHTDSTPDGPENTLWKHNQVLSYPLRFIYCLLECVLAWSVKKNCRPKAPEENMSTRRAAGPCY